MKKKQISSIVLLLAGLLEIICVYKIYEIGQEEAYVQKHSPIINMPIIGRMKGGGKVPNKIYVWYNGQRYILESPKRHFRKTIQWDSIQVNFDPNRNIAVIADVKVKTPYFLLFIILIAGLVMIGYGIRELKTSSP